MDEHVLLLRHFAAQLPEGSPDHRELIARADKTREQRDLVRRAMTEFPEPHTGQSS